MTISIQDIFTHKTNLAHLDVKMGDRCSFILSRDQTRKQRQAGNNETVIRAAHIELFQEAKPFLLGVRTNLVGVEPIRVGEGTIPWHHPEEEQSYPSGSSHTPAAEPTTPLANDGFMTNIVGVDDDGNAVQREQRQQDETEPLTAETDSWQDVAAQDAAAAHQWEGLEPAHIDEISFVAKVSEQSCLQLRSWFVALGIC